MSTVAQVNCAKLRQDHSQRAINVNKILLIARAFALVLRGCVGFAVSEYDARYGTPQLREALTASGDSVEY